MVGKRKSYIWRMEVNIERDGKKKNEEPNKKEKHKNNIKYYQQNKINEHNRSYYPVHAKGRSANQIVFSFLFLLI